ncbi:MAG: DUF5615 family PIN-like protein [Candidatus Coatesbacteria bacterium]
MLFLLDQDVYEHTFRFLCEAGHECLRARDLGLARAMDERLLAEAVTRSAIMVTRDKGYGALVFGAMNPSTGVILMRFLPAQLDAAHETLLKALSSTPEAELKAGFLTVEPGQWRMRRVRGGPARS